jgi:hypothetical protein
MESFVLLIAVAMFGQVANQGEVADDASEALDARSSAAGAPAENGTGASKPEKVSVTQMIRSLTQPSGSDQLAGVRMTLAEVVGTNLMEGPSWRAEQTGRVEAYWDLFAATALFHLANRHELELQTLRKGIRNPGLLWKQAEIQAQQSTKLAWQRAMAAQYQLRQLLGPPDSDLLNGGPIITGPLNEGPLPRCAELPHCGRYNSRYNTLFEERPSPVAKKLDELLDSEYVDLVAQSKAISMSTERLHHLSISRKPESDGTEILSAYQLLVLQRVHFVEAVRQYNRCIVRYVHLAAPAPLDTNRLVAMLIYQPPSKREAEQAEKPVSDNVQNPAGGPSGGPMKTFAEPSSTDGASTDGASTDGTSTNETSTNGRGAWTQPRKDDTPTGEHSILVAPPT